MTRRYAAFGFVVAFATMIALDATSDPGPGHGRIVDAETMQDIPQLTGTGTPIAHALVSIDWPLVELGSGAHRRHTEVTPVNGRFELASRPIEMAEGWVPETGQPVTIRILMGGWSHPPVAWRGGDVTFAMRRIPESREPLRAQLAAWRQQVDAGLAGRSDEEALRSQRVLL